MSILQKIYEGGSDDQAIENQLRALLKKQQQSNIHAKEAMTKSISEKLNKFNELKHTVARLEQELAEIKPLMKQEQKDLA